MTQNGGSDPIAPNPTAPLLIAAIAATGLLLFTLVTALSHRRDHADPPQRAPRSVDLEPPTVGRCAVHHARFGGGRRAQLVKVMQGSVPYYVVLDIGRRDPLLRLQRLDWLRATFGGGEQVWLGEFGSAETALARAARLCPPASRCWPGDADCGPPPGNLTPAQIFMQR